MSIVTHPKFTEKRVELEVLVFNELYSSLDCYIGLVKAHLNYNQNPSATAALERLLLVVDGARSASLSFEQRLKYINVIKSGVSLLNFMMNVK